MKERNEYITQLYQIKILLLVLVILCVLGFYGISRSMWDDMAVTVTKACEALLVIAFLIAPAMFIVWIRALMSLSKTNAKPDVASEDIAAEAASGDSRE